MRYKLVNVKSWIKEGNKIYLITGSGDKYRYVGRYDLQRVIREYPKGTILKIVITSNKLLIDEQIDKLS